MRKAQDSLTRGTRHAGHGWQNQATASMSQKIAAYGTAVTVGVLCVRV
jgi:hypothetical protein